MADTNKDSDVAVAADSPPVTTQESDVVAAPDDQSIIAQLFSSCERRDSASVSAEDVIEQLDTSLQHLDLNQLTNSIGESPLHVAASNDNLEMVKVLQSKGASLAAVNRTGDTLLHCAARNGHLAILSYLQEQGGVDANKQNEAGETAIHIATRNGHSKLVEALVLAGADPNLQNKKGYTALHLACQSKNIAIALMLLYLGCKMDVLDLNDEMAIHDACREALLPIVQTMCSQGSPVDTENKSGMTPLHLAAKTGNVETVRCLLLSGADIDKYNKDGVRAEDIAVAQGHTEVADLLSKLSASITSDRRDPFVRQLLPTKNPIDRIKMKVFGSGGVGKTTLIESLKCGYFRSFFRRAYAGYNTPRFMKAPTDDGRPARESVQLPYEGYTRGIDVQQVALSGVGEVSVWEFSGFEPYYGFYDFFVGDPSCIHVVVINAKDGLEVQRAQLFFWLNFIRSRIPPAEPIGYAGAQLWAPHVILVATNANDTICKRDPNGEYILDGWVELDKELRRTFDSDLIIIPRLFTMDAQQAMSVEMKSLRTALGKTKSFLCQYLGNSLGILDLSIAEFPSWTRMLGGFPTVSWSSFIEYIRARVNLLATEDHIKELVGQLQMCGEIVYLAVPDKEDLIVLNPKWLSVDVLGKLLSFEQICTSPETGKLSREHLRLLFPKLDFPDLKKLLQALDLCVECQSDVETEYLFPAYNLLQAPSSVRDEFSKEGSVVGGVRICCPSGYGDQLMHIFPRIVVALFRSATIRPGVVEVQQWSNICKLTTDNMSAIVQISLQEQEIVIECCGREDQRSPLFRFAEFIYGIILKTVDHCCPGVYLTRYPLCPTDLKSKSAQPRAYVPASIIQTQLDRKAEVCLNDEITENLVDVMAFGSEEIYSLLTPGSDLHITQLSMYTRCQLSALLDPNPPPSGNNWKALATALDVLDKLPPFDKPDSVPVSKTDVSLAVWSYKPSSTVRVLVEKLAEIGRMDAVEVVQSQTPLFFYQSLENEASDA